MSKLFISSISTVIIVGFWLSVTSLFVSYPAHAGAEGDARQFCEEYKEKSGYGCQVEKCRCGRGEKELERWNRKMRFDICACVNASAYEVYLEKIRAERKKNRCDTDVDCSDGIYCNGEEVCRKDENAEERSLLKNLGRRLGSGTCVPGEPPCASNLCFEEEKQCKVPCEDKDGDGHKAMHCGGDDCDDNNPNRSPSSTEICDSKGIDEDCNARTVGDLDADGDGFVSAQCR